MSEYFFRRYRNGERMAEDVRITQAATLEEASLAASRIAAQYRDGTVLVSEREVDLRAELAAEERRIAVMAKEIAELRSRPDALRADKAEAELDALRELLREATDKLQPISALVDMTPSGFPDHDICPIRLGMARDLRELRARIDAALKGDGDE